MLDPGHGKKIMNLRNIFKAHYCVLFSCACLINSSFAQDFPEDEDLLLLYGDEETISIATGSSKPLRLAPSVASVITADDIRTMGARDLDDILETIPGVHVSLSTRYSSLVSIRGIHTEVNPQVLMLINGYPITDLFTGARAPTFRLPVHNIERVEVIRGPGSAVFGADAFSGVINVITKSAENNQGLQGGVGAGSFDTYSAWLQYGFTWSGWDLGFSLETDKSKGDDDRIISQDFQSVLIDPALMTNASLAPGSAVTHYEYINTQLQASQERWTLTLNSWFQDEAGLGPGGANALDPKGNQEVKQHLLDISYENPDLFTDWIINVDFNYLYLDQESKFTLLPPGAILPIGADGNVDFFTPAGIVSFPDGLKGNPGGKDKSISTEMTAVYSGFNGHELRMSSGYKSQKISPYESKNFGLGVIDGSVPVIDGTLTDVTGTAFIYLRDRDREIAHLSIQHQWSFLADWELTSGVRYDDYSDFGNTLNPRVALVWQTLYNLTSKILYGRAFRAPAISEQFAINNPVLIGNAHIDPEEIDTLELSFDYRPTYDLNFQLSLFRYEIDGLIDFLDDDGLPGGTSTAQNAFDQNGYGLELEVEWQLANNLSLLGNYALQKSKNKKTNESVADAPGSQLFLSLNWKISDQWNLNTHLHHIADRTRGVVDLRGDVDDYTLVNLTLASVKFSNTWDLALSVRNLFDEDAFEPSESSIPNDNPLEGRGFFIETQIYFND